MRARAVPLYCVVSALVLAACSGEVSDPSGGPNTGLGSAGGGSFAVAGAHALAGAGAAGGGGGVGGMNGAGNGGAGGDASNAMEVDASVDGGGEPCVCDGSVAPTAACQSECKFAFEVLFSDRQLPSFYLTVFDDNGGGGNGSSWDNIITNCTQEEAGTRMPPLECEHQLATFHAEYDPTPEDDDPTPVVTPELEVGVHRKGRASWDLTNQKPPFKIKFTEFGGERFLGLTRLTLNNAIQDPSMLRERVSYHVYRAAGVVAPMANNAKVYIRKNATAAYEYYGVYVNVQTLDRRFVEHHFDEVGEEVGNLYDTYNDKDMHFAELDRADCRDQAGTAPGAQEARFELETNEAVSDRSDLTALIDSVFKPGCSTSPLCTGSNCCCRPTNWDQSNFVEAVSARLNLDALLRLMAVQALNTDWDGFAGTRNNFKLYHDLVTDKFYVFPWGTDQSLDYQDKFYYPNWNYALNHTNSNRTRSLFMIRCEDDPSDCYAKYLAQVESVRAVYAALPLRALVDTWEAQIEDAVLADTRKNSFYDDTKFRRNVDAVRQYVEKRAACVAKQLAGMPCETLSCPVGMSDCNTGSN